MLRARIITLKTYILGNLRSAWIDVRDCADAHILALQKEEVSGERIIPASGPWNWQDWGKLYVDSTSKQIAHIILQS